MKREERKELDSKATFLRKKAEKLLHEYKFNKAIKNFLKSADIYEKIATQSKDKTAFSLAMEDLVNVAKILVEREEYLAAAKIQARLADINIIRESLDDAADYYNVAAKFILKSGTDDLSAMLKDIFMYSIILYLQAENEKVMDFLKKILAMIDQDRVQDDYTYKLLKRFFSSLGKKPLTDKKFDETLLYKEGFTKNEVQLAKIAFRLRILVNESRFIFYIKEPEKKEGFMEGDEIISALNVEIIEDPFLSRISDYIKIMSISVEKSNALSMVSKFKVPATVNLGGKLTLQETFKSYYPGENEIGPIKIEMTFHEYKMKKIINGTKFTVHGQPANITINIEELSEPMIGKAFPLQIEVINESRGDANDLEIEILLPEDDNIQLVRGTLKKKLFSLVAGAATTWEIMLRPSKEGEYHLKANIQYKDAQGNQLGPVTKDIMLEIKI
ncbi:MAG: primase-like DNA-binding domain-containing protein [Promethearchaeota archaeon]